MNGPKGVLLLLVGTLALLAAAPERRHWRRADGGRTDAAALAATLEACRRSAQASGSPEQALGACMGGRGYFTWDGV